MRKVKLLSPSGYCAGVINAINIALKARKENGDKPIFLIGMIVHNDIVINMLKDKNIECLESKEKDKESLLRSLPDGSIIIFSAHGHNPMLDMVAARKNFEIYDATCPKVRENMRNIIEETLKGNEVIYIGKKDHPECDAALSLSNKVSLYDTKLLFNYSLITSKNPLVINQTTLNYLALKDIHEEILEHIPNAIIKDEICASTRLRQEAVKNIDLDCDLIIVIGDKKSSNSNKLLDVAKTCHPNIESVMISQLNELDCTILDNKKYVSITSGASTPPEVIDNIFNFVKNY